VHGELKDYLIRTERDIKDQSDMWNDKAERMREELELEIRNLQD
jgi:hypothetical protein